MKARASVFAAALAFALLLPPMAVRAEGFEFVGEDGGLYRYEFPDGAGFVSAAPNGEPEMPFGAFEFDEGVSALVFLDGNVIEYTNSDVLDKSGEYRLIIAHGDDVGEFSFSVTETDLGAVLPENVWGVETGEVMENAPLATTLTQDGWFRLSFPNGQGFTATAPNGAVTDEDFALRLAEGMAALGWLNGSPIGVVSDGVYTEEGVYRFQIVSGPSYSSDEDDKTTYSANFGVWITRRAVSGADVALPPLGFHIRGFSEGNPPGLCDENKALLTGDGVYGIICEADFMPGLTYVQRVERDASPPLLFFTEEGLFGFSEEPVLYRPSEEGVEVSVTLNGVNIPANGVLAANGLYRLRVADAAGNYRVYWVSVRLAPQVPWRLIIMMSAAAAVGAAAIFCLRRFGRPRVI